MQVAQATSRKLDEMSPYYLNVRCITKDTEGNANPFCPLPGGTLPPAVGFQFVPSLGASACANGIRRRDRGDKIAWASELVSPAIEAAELMYGIAPEDVAGDEDPFQLTYYLVCYYTDTCPARVCIHMLVAICRV
jgi:hypothetical protein